MGYTHYWTIKEPIDADAFNKLSKAKMLLLDECLSSLHAESVEDIVEHIKEEFSDRLCLMTLHQTTTGIFDQVVSL